jgi:hypothetical protein
MYYYYSTLMSSNNPDSISIDDNDTSTLIDLGIDEIEALRNAVDIHDVPESFTKKRSRAIICIDIWAESRNPKDIEFEKNKYNQRIWYCKRCSFRQTIHNRIRNYLKTHLIVIIERPSIKKLAIQHSIEGIFGKQSALAEDRNLDRKRHLFAAINKPAFNEALIQLIASRNLSHTLPE